VETLDKPKEAAQAQQGFTEVEDEKLPWEE
jgi:hypothetical protein